MGADKVPKRPRGPKPEVLNLPGKWDDAVRKALAKGKPLKASPKMKRRSK